eukprot:3534931-Rhodomonas_salina.3
MAYGAVAQYNEHVTTCRAVTVDRDSEPAAPFSAFLLPVPGWTPPQLSLEAPTFRSTFLSLLEFLQEQRRAAGKDVPKLAPRPCGTKHCQQGRGLSRNITVR